jgi:hypothetical protein
MQAHLLAVLLSLGTPTRDISPSMLAVIETGVSQQKAAKTDFADPATAIYEYVRPDGTIVRPAAQGSTLNQSRAPPAFGDYTMPNDLGYKDGRAIRRNEVQVNYGPARSRPTAEPLAIDGKANILKITDPAAPHPEAPALNKSNPARSGPEKKTIVEDGVPPAQTKTPFVKDSAIKKPGSIPLLPEVPQTLRNNIESGLRQIHPITYKGTVYRNINTKYAADFDNISPSKNFRFRYNAEGEFGAGYYTELPEQSFSEIKAHGNDPFIDRSIVQAEVLAKLLDLTDPRNLNVLKISENQITGPSYVIPIEIARQAREMGFEGIRAPQADGSGKANIILFTDKFSKESYVRKLQDLKFDKQQRNK